MKRKHIIYKLALIFLTVCLLTPEYAVNVLAAPDTEKAVNTANSKAKQTGLAQPSPTPGDLDALNSGVVQPTPTPTPVPDAFSVPQIVYFEPKSPLPDGLFLTPEEVADHSALNSAEDSKKVRIETIKAKYAGTSSELNRAMIEPVLSKDQILSLLILGASVEDIYEAAYLSQEAEIDPVELYKQKTENPQSWEELRLSTTGQQSEPSSVTNEVYSVTKEVYGLADPLIPDQSLLNGLSTESSANTLLAQINAVISNTEMQSINQTNKPQYSDRSNSSELIDPSSGSLVWKENQISLPGRDGLDLNIGIMYSSSQSVNSHYNFLARQYELGVGWGFRFPTLQKTDSNDLYYHNGEGAVYEVKLSEPQGLKDYKSKDIRFAEDRSSFTNGQDFSRYYLEYADKKREYFGGDNLRLLGIVDRYGNKIVFNYTQIYDKANYTSSYLLTQITDSIGRKIIFKYDPMDKRYVYNNTDLVADENLVVSVLDLQGNKAQEVTYTRGRKGYMLYSTSPVTGQVLYTWVGETTLSLKTITDQNKDQVKFGYNQMPIYTNRDRKKFKDGDDGTSQLQAYQLENIEYPHSQTVYKYMDQFRNYGVKGGMIERVIASRYDQVIRNGNYSGEYNKAAYSYIGSYDGYDTYYKDRTGEYQYSTAVNSVLNNMQTTYAFNGKGQLLSTTTVAANGEKIVQKNTSFHAVIDTLPTASETWEYGLGDTDTTANKMYSETSYDDWGNVVTATRSLTDSQRNNPTIKARNTTILNYEPTYHFLSSKSWYANESDASALTESYTYTPQGRMLSTTNAAGETTSFSYMNAPDGTNRLYQATAVKNAGGKVVSKSVVTYGAETQYAYPSIEEAYSNIGQTNQQIVRTSTFYDMGSGRVIEKRDGENHATFYAYDAGGRLKKETLPVRTNANGERYSEVTDYNYYNQTSANFDAINAGTVVLKVDSIRTVTNLSNNKTIQTYANVLYNGLGLVLLEEQLDDSVGKWAFTQYHYDDMGRPVYSIDPAGNTLSVSYDAWGRQNRATTANGDLYVSDYALKARTSTSYIQDGTTGDKLNYVEESYDPWGQKTAVRTFKDWPSRNQPISESYRYDLSGNVTGYTDPKQNLNEDGVTTTYAYDSLGRLFAVKDALNQTTNYSYDGNGLLSKVTIQAKGGTPQTLNTKTYNELGLLSVKQDGASQSENYTYNNLGQLAAKTDRNGSAFGYTYDERGQLKKSIISGKINNITQTQETNVIFGDSDPRNQTLHTFTNSVLTGIQTYTSDSLGRLRINYAVAGGHYAYIENQIDVLGRTTRINDYYMGFYTNYQYSKQRLDKVQTNGSAALTSAATANAQYSYFGNDQVKSITYPTLTDGSILKTAYTYNQALGWTKSMTNTKSTSVLSAYSYEYDNNGNRISVSESRNGGTAQTTSYTYDALNRLVSITRPDGSQTTYTYDVRGNRLTLLDTGTVNLDMADTSYTYDLQNTLTSVMKGNSTTSFQYYADGLRAVKINSGTQTQVNYNLSGQVISEEKIVNGVFTEQANYVRGDRVLVKKDKKNAKDYYYLYNGHGDVVQIVDTTGKVINNYTYDEWGNITSQVEGTPNSFKYTGEVYDTETGLYYLRARYYDPSMGRFLNEDTVEGQIDNPLTQNLYTYVHNNPLLYSDPSGHAPIVGDSPYDTQPTNTVKGTVVKTDNAVLTQELVIMIATIYGEAANSSETSWEAIANVMMNRVGTGEWKKYTSVLEIIKHTGFDAYTQKNQPYKEAMDYLESRGGKGSQENASIEKLIQIVVDVYFNKREDITGGAVLYYSPKAQAALHKKYPKSYKENPPWNFKLLTQVKIKGLENDDFKFYKYK